MAQLVPYFPLMTPRTILFFVFTFDAESARDYFWAILTLIDQTVIVSILVLFINRMRSSFPVAYYKIFGELKPILLVFRKENG